MEEKEYLRNMDTDEIMTIEEVESELFKEGMGKETIESYIEMNYEYVYLNEEEYLKEKNKKEVM